MRRILEILAALQWKLIIRYHNGFLLHLRHFGPSPPREERVWKLYADLQCIYCRYLNGLGADSSWKHNIYCMRSWMLMDLVAGCEFMTGYMCRDPLTTPHLSRDLTRDSRPNIFIVHDCTTINPQATGHLAFRHHLELQRMLEFEERYQPETSSNTEDYSSDVANCLSHNPMATSLDSYVAQLERDILFHPEIKAHYNIVCLYLRMDLVLLEPISYLRQEGLWRSDLCYSYGTEVRAPPPDQIKDLAPLHCSLFQSPPTELFNLVCDFRRLTGFGSCRSTDQLPSLLRLRYSDQQHQRIDCRKTAPEGQLYVCPSTKCRKTFKKAGHARNHVESKHLEYLQIDPDYIPQHFVIDV